MAPCRPFACCRSNPMIDFGVSVKVDVSGDEIAQLSKAEIGTMAASTDGDIAARWGAGGHRPQRGIASVRQ
jgi:hypothetical protein